MSLPVRLHATVVLVALLALTGANAAPAGAQRPALRDTTGVLTAVAIVLQGREQRTNKAAVAAAPSNIWFVDPVDMLSARFAATVGRIARPVPPAAVCPFGAPDDAVVAYVTVVELRVVSADTVDVILSDSCRETQPTPMGTHFYLAESFRVVRRRGVWTARHTGYTIS